MPVYTYRCLDGHHTDVLSSYTDRKDTIPCEKCGKESNLVLVACGVQLDAISGDFPGATFKWERDHVKRAERERASG
jgi:putative FmdB family regulatory protein